MDINQLKQSVTISEVISRFVRLKAAGHGRFVCCCPFHQEKTPSFNINDLKGFFHCFGCGKSGDAITFLQEQMNLPFKDAAQELARIAGVSFTMEVEPKAVTLKKKSFYELMESLTAFLELRLPKDKYAIQYLCGVRRLSEADIKFFRLGLFPRDTQEILIKFPDYTNELIELGILHRSREGRLFSRFAGRVIFPICDKNGRVVAYGGRVIPANPSHGTSHGTSHRMGPLAPTTARSANEPKYYNSPESTIFKKGSILYNLHRARASKEALIVVEGYMDVASLHRIGFRNAVAQMGTAFSEFHLNLLWQACRCPVFMLDGDSAGKRAQMRIAEIALSLLKPGFSVSFFHPSAQFEFKDPDEACQNMTHGELSGVISSHKMGLFDFLWSCHSEGVNLNNPESSAQLEHTMKGLASQIKNESLSKNYLFYFKDKLYQARRQARQSLYTKNNKNNSTAVSSPTLARRSALVSRPKYCPADEMLTLLVVQNPRVLQMDCWHDYYIDIESEELAELLAAANEGRVVIRHELALALSERYPSLREPLADDSELELVYMKIYRKKLIEGLKSELQRVIKAGDIGKVAMLRQELTAANQELLTLGETQEAA